MARPSWMSRGAPGPRTPSRPMMDMSRINRAADLLAQGATVEQQPSGNGVWLRLGGSVVMHTSAGVVKEARKVGQALGLEGNH